MFKWLFIKLFLYNSIAHDFLIIPKPQYLTSHVVYHDKNIFQWDTLATHKFINKAMDLMNFSMMARRQQNRWKTQWQNNIYNFHKKLLIYGTLLLGFNVSLIVFFHYFLLFFLKNFFPYLQLALKDKLEKDEKYKDYETLIKGILESLKDNTTLSNINTGSLFHRFMLNCCQFIVFNLRDLVQVTDGFFEYTKALPVLQVITKFFQIANTTFSTAVMVAILGINFLLIYLILKSHNTINIMERKYLKNKIKTVANSNPLEKKYLKDNNLFLKTLIFNYKSNMPSKFFIMIFGLGFLTIFYMNFIFLNPKSEEIINIYKKIIHEKTKETHDNIFWDPLFLAVIIIFIGGFTTGIYIYNHRFIRSMTMISS